MVYGPIPAQVTAPVYRYPFPYPTAFERHPSIGLSGGHKTAGTPSAYRYLLQAMQVALKLFWNPTQLLIPPAPNWDNISFLALFASFGCQDGCLLSYAEFTATQLQFTQSLTPGVLEVENRKTQTNLIAKTPSIIRSSATQFMFLSSKCIWFLCYRLLL